MGCGREIKVKGREFPRCRSRRARARARAAHRCAWAGCEEAVDGALYCEEHIALEAKRMKLMRGKFHPRCVQYCVKPFHVVLDHPLRPPGQG